MDTQTLQLDLLLELEARHEELLRQLIDLDQRVEKTLAECQVYRIRPQQAAADARIG
jgi:hypothetical protein